jgi:hypothetical protein
MMSHPSGPFVLLAVYVTINAVAYLSPKIADSAQLCIAALVIALLDIFYLWEALEINCKEYTFANSFRTRNEIFN